MNYRIKELKKIKPTIMTTDQLQHLNDLHDAIESLREDIAYLNDVLEEDNYQADMERLRKDNEVKNPCLLARHYLRLLHLVVKETSAIYQLRELQEEKEEQFENL